MGYDSEFKQELEANGGNGVRQWYASFQDIDWIHDWIKAQVRLRKLRRRRRNEGLRGWLVNVWDGSQGWVVVTIVGVITACIAFMIIRSEMVLFDLKDGYCSTSPLKAKRFCCPVLKKVDVTNSATHLRSLWLVTKPQLDLGYSSTSKGEACENWRTWGQVWSGSKAGGIGGAGDLIPVDFVAYTLIAVILASVSAFLTINLTSSTSIYSSKDDSPSVYSFPSPPTSQQHPAPKSHHPAASYGATENITPNGNGTSIHDEPSSLPPPMFYPKPHKVMYFAAGSGIPEIKTILSGFVIRGYLGSWTLFTKSVGLAMSVGSGLSLGKEGPLVHVASCVGNITSRFFPKYDWNEAKRREIISAACAAGVAVSFGAPVGGTLFSLEEVSYFFGPKTMWRSFWCAMIAAGTLRLLDPFGSGKIVLFEVTYDRDWHMFELFGFLLLGAFGGIYGAVFCRTNIWWTKNVRNATFLKGHPIAEVALVTIVTAFASYGVLFTKMGGTELIYELFSECHKEESFDGLCVATPDLAWSIVGGLTFTLVVKYLLTSITFGIKVPAGIFIPTLAVGACAGRSAGLLVEILHSMYPLSPIFNSCRALQEDGPQPFGQMCVLPGVWAMVGAAATLAGVTRTTVSLAVIMFELTGTLSYTIPVMLSVLIAKTVGDAIEPRSIYDLVIELNDLPFLDVKTEYIHESSPAEIVDAECSVISLDDDNTIESLRTKLSELYADGTRGGFPIVASDDGGLRLYGYLAAKELEHGLSTASFSPLGTPCTFKSSQYMRQGMIPPASRVSTPAGCDFSYLVDLAPVTVNLRSPMVLLHEMFTKLGVRYLAVVDERGLFKGVVEKNRYLKYLQFVEHKSHSPSSPSHSRSATPAV
ncbi:hypothetical protein T439DRAFT_341321 [Meredithblackwellia eburnea MCA 4105]